jgi:hypothetical protein
MLDYMTFVWILFPLLDTMVKKDDMDFVKNVRLSAVNQPSDKKIEIEHGCILGGLSIYIVL